MLVAWTRKVEAEQEKRKAEEPTQTKISSFGSR